MKKIVSKEEHQRKLRRNQILLATLFVLIMVGSTFGIIVSSFGGQTDSKRELKYNGVEFSSYEGYWIAKTDRGNFVFYDLPGSIENYSLNIDSIDKYTQQPLYINSEDSDSEALLRFNGENFAQRVQDACINAKNCDGDYPIKDCTSNFIIIQLAETVNITQEENCVFIKAPGNEITNATEEFLYHLIQIK